MKRLIVIRLNKTTRVFENTEEQGCYTDSHILDLLRANSNCTFAQYDELDQFNKDQYRDRITLELESKNKLWFFYIIK